jgi:anti-anti-sigma factor
MLQNVNHSGSGESASAFAEDGSFNSSSVRFTARLTNDTEGAGLTLQGELDLETAPEVDRQLDRIHATQVKRVLIDLSGVTFMDSTGLSAIVRASRFAESNGQYPGFAPGRQSGAAPLSAHRDREPADLRGPVEAHIPKAATHPRRGVDRLFSGITGIRSSDVCFKRSIDDRGALQSSCSGDGARGAGRGPRRRLVAR